MLAFFNADLLLSPVLRLGDNLGAHSILGEIGIVISSVSSGYLPRLLAHRRKTMMFAFFTTEGPL